MIDMTVNDMKLTGCEHCDGFSVLILEKDLDRITILLSDDELIKIVESIKAKFALKGED